MKKSIVLAVLLLCLSVSANAISWKSAGEFWAASPGQSVRGLAISADGEFLYAGGLQGQEIVAVDISSGDVWTRASLSQLNAGAWGKAVTVDANGDVWAPGSDVLEIYLFDADLIWMGTYSLVGLDIIDCEGLLVDAKGNIYVAERGGRAGLIKLYIDGNELDRDWDWGRNGSAEIGGEVRQPALGYDGRIYVGLYDGGRGDEIYVVDSKGNAKRFAQGVPSPYHLAVDGQGYVYVAQYDAKHALTILSPDGKIVAQYTHAQLGIETEASGVAVSKDGKWLFVVDQRPSPGGIIRWFVRN